MASESFTSSVVDAVANLKVSTVIDTSSNAVNTTIEKTHRDICWYIVFGLGSSYVKT